REACELLKGASWGPVNLDRSARVDTTASTLTLQGGRLDPVTGRSYRQLAMAGRNRHRSQDMGQLELPGPSAIRLALWERRDAGRGMGDGVGRFAGVASVLTGRERFVA